MFAEKPGFKYVPHTADVKFIAEGRDMSEAFRNAAFATFNVIVDTDKVEPIIEKTISIEARRELSLLYDFLEELLFLLDTDGFLLSEMTVITIRADGDKHSLTATFKGDVYTADNKYDVQGNIKSVTYNDMRIDRKEEGVELSVVLDL